MKGKRITKRLVDAVRPTTKDLFLWDKDLPGFGLKVTRKGSRSYVFQYSIGRRDRRVTIGRHGAPWTPDQARTEALRLRGEVAAGLDPATAKLREKRAQTLREFKERYLREHAEPKKKPSSLRNDKGILDRVIVPQLGHRKVADITREEVTRLHLSMKDTPYQANRTLALLSKMMNLAEKWGIRPDGSNPCRHVEKFREGRRERFLSESELANLGKVLRVAETAAESVPESEFRAAIAAIRLLLLTGCRLSEILTLKWEFIDREHSCLRLPDSKTGAKIVIVPTTAMEILAGLPRIVGNPYVIPGKNRRGHLVNLSRIWSRLRIAAEIPDVRLHDLRHSFASFAVSGGESLPILGGLLGHADPATTARYAHLSVNSLREAADRISGRIAVALQGEKKP